MVALLQANERFVRDRESAMFEMTTNGEGAVFGTANREREDTRLRSACSEPKLIELAYAFEQEAHPTR